MSTALLLTEPEPITRTYLERHLRSDGFEIVAATERRPDLVLADEDADLERLRQAAPVIMLGRAEADPVDRVRAFRRGCDDYVARPFNYDELVARIHAVLRRTRPPRPPVVEAGPLSIDETTRIVRVNGVRVTLAQKEYALLVRLAREPERVFTKDELLRDVWGYAPAARTRTLDSHASRLRRKLRAAHPAGGLLVDNVWGVGYRLLASLQAA
jgi:DNA-binding response OmpR family regulator